MPSDMRPVRCSVAAVLRNEQGAFLFVRRPLDDDSLPGAWGLPAVTLSPGELPEAGLSRIGTDKLGIRLVPTRIVGARSADRGEYELILMDMEATVLEGIPDVHRASGPGTRYIDQQWSLSLEPLREGARKGSLCCQILLAAADPTLLTPP